MDLADHCKKTTEEQVMSALAGFGGKKSGKAFGPDAACARELWLGRHGGISKAGQNDRHIVG
jgi:hypothetical protein